MFIQRKTLYKYLQRGLLTLLSVIISPYVMAHLMVAQHGTLNIIDDGAFLVLSLPVSAFENIDSDNDGKMSHAEFIKYRSDMLTAISQQVRLVEQEEYRSLQGILLSPTVPHHAPDMRVEQIVITGKFTVTDADSALSIQIGLFGQDVDEKVFKITVIRNSSISSKQTVMLTPEQPLKALFTG